MHPGLCDGLPVNYSPSGSTGSNPRRACTTQSTDSSGDFSNLVDFYNTTATLQIAETSQPPAPLHQTAHLSPVPNTSVPIYPLPDIHTGACSSAQGMWPTPPATACEDFDDYTCQGSPTTLSCAGPVAASVVAFSATSSATSPRNWPSPDAQQLAFRQSAWKTQDILPPYSMRICSDVTTEDRFHQQMISSSYPNSTFFGGHNENVDPDSFMASEAPAMTPDLAESAISDPSPSPLPKHEFAGSFPFENEEIPSELGQENSEAARVETSKAEEPYAQLIFRAFMSRQQHAMTLQEIYQWFRENTDKAKTEKKGWQNSIRHNLSMNAAFVKPDRDSGSRDAMADAGVSKKSTEWMLEDWAVRDGVQSTTRYRKGNTSRRVGSNSRSRSRYGRSISERASSGRKGGLTTSRLKGASRTALRRHQYRAAIASNIPSSRYLRDNGHCEQNSSMEYAGSVRDEPVTPSDVSTGQVLFSETMHGPQALGTNNGQGYYYGPIDPQQRQLHHPQHAHSLPDPNEYRLENITGVYEPPSIPPTSGAADPAQLSSHLPSGFTNLFIEDIREGVPESTARIANLNYNWGDGGSYQS